jgi:PadR family transcriptional regulator, regulatory protein PadR
MPMERLTRPTRLVLTALLERPRDEHYGLELCRKTGLPSGTLYQILARMEQAGWVERRWEATADHEAERRPRRRYYRMTPDGQQLARSALDKGMASVIRLKGSPA